jgi:hypothetical protein
LKIHPKIFRNSKKFCQPQRNTRSYGHS